MNENKPIPIQEVCERWSISRPTVMQAISKRRLIGEKINGKWFFEPAAVVRWRGEPDVTQTQAHQPTQAAAPVAAEPTPTSQWLTLAEDFIASLKDQLDVKDKQIAEHQETLREQLRLLTYAGPAMEKQNDEVEQLKLELKKKDDQIEKLTVETAEKVALLMRGQALAVEQKEQAEVEMLAPEPAAASIAATRSIAVERMMASKPKVQTAADNFDRWGDE